MFYLPRKTSPRGGINRKPDWNPPCLGECIWGCFRELPGQLRRTNRDHREDVLVTKQLLASRPHGSRVSTRGQSEKPHLIRQFHLDIRGVFPKREQGGSWGALNLTAPPKSKPPLGNPREIYRWSRAPGVWQPTSEGGAEAGQEPP